MKNDKQYTVEKMCKCMKVSRNAYYNWTKKENIEYLNTPIMVLKERIRSIFYNSKEIYGSARVQKMLEREELYYSRSYVAVLMREMGLRSVLKKKFVITTDSNHHFPIPDNRLDREFESFKLGEKWVSDITYIRVGENWNYLTTIMDLADRKIVGWSLSEDMRVENTIYRSWLKAINTRKISDNLIFHSDRGVQYASTKMTSLFSMNTKIVQSMSRKGNCWYNAVAESFFKTIKYECLNKHRFLTYEKLYNCTSEYINWYNRERIHSSLGYLTPLEMEIKLKSENYKIAA